MNDTRIEGMSTSATDSRQPILAVTGLAKAFAGQATGSLPYGLQRRLEIARALGTQPSLLLLDEPAAGMNPSESDDLHHLILRLCKGFNLAILLVEHDMRLVMNLCERIVVLNYGHIIAQGTPGMVRNRIEPPPAVPGIAYGLDGVQNLPTRLEWALDALEQDAALRTALGDEFIKLFVAVKRHEIAKARANCTDYDAASFGDRVEEWERQEYCEFL
jgi:ABC-type multidrug transport system ATPase subunit